MHVIRLLLAVLLLLFSASCRVPMPEYSTHRGNSTYQPYSYTPIEGTSRSRPRSTSSSTWYHSDGSTSKAW